jgi:hypothetical protein
VGKGAASNVPKSVKQASSIASSSSATCDWCQGEFKSTSGVRLHKLKCKKQPEEKSVDPGNTGTASTSHQSPAFLSSLDKEDNTKGKHLDKFFASMQISGTPDTPTTPGSIGERRKAGETSSDIFKIPSTSSLPRTRATARKERKDESQPRKIDFSTASTTMEIDHQSESSFHSCSEASAGEISASRILIDSSDDEERRSTSSRVTRSSTRNVTPVKKPPSNLSARKLKFKRKSRDKNIARASTSEDESMDAEESDGDRPAESRANRKDPLRKIYKEELAKLKKKLPKGLQVFTTSNREIYNKVENAVKKEEREQETLINLAKSTEVIVGATDPTRVGELGRADNMPDEDRRRLKESKENGKKATCQWPWKPKKGGVLDIFNNEVLELWHKTSSEFNILKCPECKGVVVQLGDQLGKEICSTCMELSRMRDGERKEKLKNHLEKMKPTKMDVKLPELNAAEKAIIAPVHPVVTVTKNSMHKKRFKQECINLLRHPDELWALVLPRVSLKQRFVIIERRLKGLRRGLKINPQKIYKWLDYLFKHHKGFIQKKNEGTLKLSLAAMDELNKKKDDVLEDVTSDSGASDSDDTTTAATIQKQKRDPAPVGHHAELDAGLSKKEVFCLDPNPSLYMKQRDFLKIEKDGKLAIIPDLDRRTPLYDPATSSNLPFPHLYPNGEEGPADIREYSLAKTLLKLQTHFAEELKDGKLQWKFSEDSIHMMHEYSRILEMEAHARCAGYFIQQGSGANEYSLEELLDAFEAGPDGHGKFETNIPDLHTMLAQMNNTREKWFSQRLQIESMSRDMGDANYFLTLNTEPRSWPDVRRLIYALENGQDKEMPKDWFIRNNETYTNLMEKYAVQISEYLAHKTSTLLKSFFTDICGIPEKEFDKDWRSKGDEGRYSQGWYWGRAEFTETRGIQHYHILAKLPEVLDSAIIAKLVHRGRVARMEIKAGNIKAEYKEEMHCHVEVGYIAESYACQFAESVALAYFSNKDVETNDKHDPADIINLAPYVQEKEKIWKSKDPKAINCKTNPIMREFDDSDIEDFPGDPVKKRNVENAKVAANTGLHGCFMDNCGGQDNQSGKGCRYGFPKTIIPYTVCCVYPVNKEQVEMQVIISIKYNYILKYTFNNIFNSNFILNIINFEYQF